MRPRIEGTPVPGHSVTNVSVTPSQVRVEGPESAVNGADRGGDRAGVRRAAPSSLVREAVTIDLLGPGVRLSAAAARPW